MDKNTRRKNAQRLAKQRERERIVKKQRLILAACIAAAVVVLIIVWRVAAPNAAADRKSADESISTHAVSVSESTPTPQPTQAPENTVIQEPEAADGTADAGIMKLMDDRKDCAQGWNENETGKWYAPEEGTCYYSGWLSLGNDTYHFDENGYAATGWTAISYRDGRYFTEDGIYVPNVDNSKMICLTFDDGPTEKTPEVLDILAEYDVKATFFVLGVQLEKENYGEVIPRMIEEGHQIGSHSYSHIDMLNADDQTIIDEFNRTDSLLAAYGTYPTIVRFPYGDYTPEKVALTNRSNILWDNDSLDWEDGSTAESILNNISNYLEGGNIILMHDMYDSTLEALPQLLQKLADEGYECVTLDEMIASRGYTKRPGVTFLGFKQLNLDQGRVDDT